MEVSLQSFRKRFTYDPQKDLLGKGGFGDVYKAFDNEDQIFVALKIAHASADDKHNLINEIKRFKKLNHPNIIKHIEAYEVNTGGFDIHGRPIINHVGVLEYADKGTLADFLKSKTPIGFRQTIEDLAHDIIDGLAYLHSQNIIHRDLKPTNILIFSDGDKLRAKITDFGIAKQADATAASTQLVGTVEYMAPEYFTTGNITKSSDLWSLGVMLLEALSGTHPFGKTTQGLSNEQIIRNILSKDLQDNLSNAPLKELLSPCLLREPQLRQQNAEALKNVLTKKTDNDFADRTVIIGAKPQKAAKANDEPKWKRILRALFDFDVSNGKWRKVLARELLLAMLLPFVLHPFLWLLISPFWYIMGGEGSYSVTFTEFLLDFFDHVLFRDDKIFAIGISFGVVFLARYLVAVIMWTLKTLGIDLSKIINNTNLSSRFSKFWRGFWFDFTFENGRWKKVLIREAFVILTTYFILKTGTTNLGLIIFIIALRYLIPLYIFAFYTLDSSQLMLKNKSTYRNQNKDEEENIELTPVWDNTLVRNMENSNIYPAETKYLYFQNWETNLTKMLFAVIIFVFCFPFRLFLLNNGYLSSILWYIIPFLVLRFFWFAIKIFLPEESNKLQMKNSLWENRKAKIKFILFCFWTILVIYHQHNSNINLAIILAIPSALSSLIFYYLFKKIEDVLIFIFVENKE
jgi:hypothetical protein